MRVLLTGAAGRLGAATYQRLLEDDLDVVAVDRIFSPEIEPDRQEVIDLHDLPAVYRVMRGVDVLVHLANAANSFTPDHRSVFLNNNAVNGNVLLAAAQMRVRRVIYASSIQAVTGDRTDPQQPSGLAYLPIDPAMPGQYGNLYGMSKAIGEEMLAFHCRTGSLEGISIRFPALYDPRWSRRSRRSSEHLGGSTRLDEAGCYLFMSDAAELIARCIAAPQLPGYRVYVPSGPVSNWNLPLAEVIERVFPNVPLHRPVEQLTTLIDQDHLAADLGWTPPTGLSTD